MIFESAITTLYIGPDEKITFYNGLFETTDKNLIKKIEKSLAFEDWEVTIQEEVESPKADTAKDNLSPDTKTEDVKDTTTGGSEQDPVV